MPLKTENLAILSLGGHKAKLRLTRQETGCDGEQSTHIPFFYQDPPSILPMPACDIKSKQKTISNRAKSPKYCLNTKRLSAHGNQVNKRSIEYPLTLTYSATSTCQGG